MANLVDGFDKSDQTLQDKDLKPFLDEDGNVNRDAVGNDPDTFRSAADFALGTLDDEWTNGFNRAADNPDWSK